MVTVLSVGGSIVAPDKPDFDFLDKFSKIIRIEKLSSKVFLTNLITFWRNIENVGGFC